MAPEYNVRRLYAHLLIVRPRDVGYLVRGVLLSPGQVRHTGVMRYVKACILRCEAQMVVRVHALGCLHGMVIIGGGGFFYPPALTCVRLGSANNIQAVCLGHQRVKHVTDSCLDSGFVGGDDLVTAPLCVQFCQVAVD